MERIFQNKKGISLTETLAYIVLYGAVASMLTTLVFVIASTSRKVTAQSILNKGVSIMYTELLSQSISLSPDTVVSRDYSEEDNVETISITLEKKWYYDSDGKRLAIHKNDTSGYSTKPSRITYTYTSGSNNISVYYYTIKTSTDTSSGEWTSCENTFEKTAESEINLEYNMTISSINSTSISDFITVDKQNSSNEFVTFRGKLSFDNKTTDFNFIIPIFIAKA